MYSTKYSRSAVRVTSSWPSSTAPTSLKNGEKTMCGVSFLPLLIVTSVSLTRLPATNLTGLPLMPFFFRSHKASAGKKRMSVVSK